MSTAKRPTAQYEDEKSARWARREKKRKPRMRVHGQGMKKLARRLQEREAEKR